ncbi:MAG: hypothetical protein ACXW2Y_00390 [Acidimicrobiia bacterium]
MDFIDACKVVLRRWYVAVPLLLLTFAGTFLAFATASADYSAKGSLILIQPASRVVKEGEPADVCATNPWCPEGDVLSLANVTTLTMDDPEVYDQLLDPHPGASYEVVLNAENRSAIMELTATARTPKDALDTLRDLSAQVEKELNERQVAGRGAVDTPVDPRDLVTTSQVTMANRARPQSGGKLRAAAGAFGLGIAVTLGATFLAESMAVSRRTKASLLDRIALPDQPMSAPKARRSASEIDDAVASAGQRSR